MTAHHPACIYGQRRKQNIVFESETKVLDVVGKLNAVELSDNENQFSDEAASTQIHGGYDLGRGQTRDPKSSKRFSLDKGFPRSSRQELRHRANTQQRLRSFDDSSSKYGNLPATLLQNENNYEFYTIGLMTMKEAKSVPDSDEGRQTMEKMLHGLW